MNKTQYKDSPEFSIKTTRGENTSNGEMRFEGYLSVFGNVDSYGDVVVKGAFAKSIQKLRDENRLLPVLENHGGWKMTASDVTPIGYFDILEEDETGLYVKGFLIDSTRGRDMYALLKASPKGQMGMSIGYRVIRSRNATRDEIAKTGAYAYLEELELMEGSVVTFPANTEARVEDVKSEVLQIRTFERALKEEGFNAREAKNIVRIFKKSNALNRPEPIDPEGAPSGADSEDLAQVLDDFRKSMEEQTLVNSLDGAISRLRSI